MQVEDFKTYLQIIYPDSEATVSSRISNCLNVEKHYGSLDDNFNRDYCNQILTELSYSKDDEINNRLANHPIQINGNIRTGSATLKQAVNRYVDFRNFIIDADDSRVKNTTFISTAPATTISNEIRSKLLVLLGCFNFDPVLHKDTTQLQQSLLEHFSANITDFDWETEFKPKADFRDRVDIYGASRNSRLKVVIELDAHRADQVAKKFISRTALFIDENIVYVSLCYPGTNRMSKVECEKYFNYCSEISKHLSMSSGKEQMYIGYFLN